MSSGNFDFPPATRPVPASNPDRAPEILRDVSSHRSILRNRLDEVRRLRDHMTDSDERQRLRMQQSAIREEIRRRAEQSSSIGHSTSDAQAPTSAMRARPQSYRQRARDRLQDQSSPSASGGTVQQAVERLNQASSNLSSLLDQPNLRLSSPDGNARDHLGEAEVNRRGAKRRKMDANPLAVGHLRGFNYGHRGQVVSGPLKMEIFVCDGGLHGDSATHEREYMPENVLRNDKSVYCTSGNTCNLILRHMGETTFCLKKLVIKAPERGFTAPLQEGMVFISMTSSDLLDRTSQYQMQGHSPLQNIDESEPLFSDDPNENRPLSRRRDSSVQRIIPPPISNLTSRSNNHNMGTTYNADVNGTSASRNSLQHIDRGDDNVSNPRSGIHPAASEFAVTTTCNDPSSDEEETSSAATLADRYRRDRLLPPYELSSEEDTEDGLERAMRRARSMGIPSSQNYYRRSRRKAQPSKIEIMRPAGVASLDSRSGESKRVLAPHASFFIERDRSVISVKFDPPVLVPLSWLMVDLADPSIHPRSGKFVLLKLWSPSRDENIDIQSIMAHGFAGPRFFPAAHRM